VLHISDIIQADKNAWCGRSVNVYKRGIGKKTNSLDSSEGDIERKTVSHRE